MDLSRLVDFKPGLRDELEGCLIASVGLVVSEEIPCLEFGRRGPLYIKLVQYRVVHLVRQGYLYLVKSLSPLPSLPPPVCSACLEKPPP